MQAPLKDVARGTALIFIGGALSLLLGLVSKIVIAQNSTKEEFGLYSLVMALVSVFALFSTLGIHEGISRQVSVSLGEGKNEDAAAMARASLQIGFLSGSILFLALFFLSVPISINIFHSPQLASPLRVISFFIPMSVLAQIKVGVLRGRGLIWPQIYLAVGQSLFFLCTVGIFFVVGMPFISVMYAYLLSTLAACLIIGGFGNEDLRTTTSSFRKERRYYYHLVLKFSLPLLVVNMTSVVLSWTDSLMLGRYAGAAAVGGYNVSLTLARILEFPIVALAFVFMPIAGDLFAKQQISELKQTYQILTKWIFFVTLPFFFILTCFPEIIIRVLFGEQFVTSAQSLRILSLGFMSSAFWGVNGVLLVVLGMARPLMYINVFGAVLNVILNFLFIKEYGYGLLGAATASMISIFLMNIIASSVIYHQSAIHPLSFQYIKLIAGSVIIAIIVLIISQLFTATLWLLPLYIFMFIAGLVVTLFVIRGLDCEDIALFETVLTSIGIPRKVFEKWIC